MKAGMITGLLVLVLGVSVAGAAEPLSIEMWTDVGQGHSFQDQAPQFKVFLKSNRDCYASVYLLTPAHDAVLLAPRRARQLIYLSAGKTRVLPADRRFSSETLQGIYHVNAVACTQPLHYPVKENTPNGNVFFEDLKGDSFEAITRANQSFFPAAAPSEERAEISTYFFVQKEREYRLKRVSCVVNEEVVYYYHPVVHDCVLYDVVVIPESRVWVSWHFYFHTHIGACGFFYTSSYPAYYYHPRVVRVRTARIRPRPCVVRNVVRPSRGMYTHVRVSFKGRARNSRVVRRSVHKSSSARPVRKISLAYRKSPNRSTGHKGSRSTVRKTDPSRKRTPAQRSAPDNRMRTDKIRPSESRPDSLRRDTFSGSTRKSRSPGRSGSTGKNPWWSSRERSSRESGHSSLKRDSGSSRYNEKKKSPSSGKRSLPGTITRPLRPNPGRPSPSRPSARPGGSSNRSGRSSSSHSRPSTGSRPSRIKR